MKTNYYKGLLLVFLTLFTFNKVAAQCVVTAYAQNITANCGTGIQTYDVVVEYVNKPATGNIRLRNSTGNISTASVASIGSSTYTFTGVTFNMTGGEQDVYVDFSANSSCVKYLHIPLYSCTSYPTNSTVGTYVATVTNGKKYTASGSNEYVLNYNGDLTIKHNGDYLAAFKTSIFQNVEYFFYTCKPDVAIHPYLSKCSVIDNTGTFGAYNSNIPSFPNPDMKEISLGNASDIIGFYANTFTENKVWVMPSVNDFIGASVTIPANYFANGTPFSIQYLNQITATKTDNCGGGSVNFTSLFGGYPEFHASNYTIINNGNGTLSTTSVALNGSFSLTGLANGASYNVTVTDVNGGQTILSGTFCSAAATTSCSTCAAPTCPIAGPYTDLATASTISNHCSLMQTISTPVQTGNSYVSYYTVKTGSSGDLGVVISSGYGNVNPGTCDGIINRTAVLYTSPNTCATAGISPSSIGGTFYNPVWTGLTPNTTYIVKVTATMPGSFCQLQDQCASYYTPAPSCATCATPTCSATSITETTLALGRTNISTALATAGNVLQKTLTAGQSVTVCVPVTVPAGSTALGFKQLSTQSPSGCVSPLEEVITYTLKPTNCSGSGITPTRTNAGSVASGFNPEWDNIAAGNYVLCFTENVTNTALCSTINLNGLGYYNIIPTCTNPATPTINSGAATCSAAGTSTISNYNASNTYTFTPSGPSVGAGGLINGMTIGTSYTVTAKVSTCTSSASATFSNAATQTTPVVPTINSVAATCSVAGTSTISNYNAAYTYTFSPSGPTVGAGGLINGMTIGTSYTVTAKLGSCTSVASFTFSNATTLVTPVTPTISSGVATCSAVGTSTISNYNAAYTYNFTPSGPTVGAGGLISGMTAGTSYTVTAILGICNSSSSVSFSNAAALTKPTATLSGSTTICNGVSTNLSVSFTGTQPWTLTYLEGSSTKIVSSSSSPLLISATPSTTTIYTLVSVSDAICTNTASGTATINVTPKTALVVSCGTPTPTSVAFNWNTISDATGYSYTYSINGGSPVTNTLPSGTTTLTVIGVVAGQNVSITVTPIGSACATAGSGNCSASNCPLPLVNTINDVVACGSSTINAIPLSSPTPSVTFNWFNNNTAIGLGASGSGSTIPSFTTANVTSTQVATITVTASEGPCTGPAQTFKITINPVKTPTFSVVTTICSGDTYTLPPVSNEGITGTWAPAFNANQTKEYTFTPTNDVCALTAKLNITVNPSPTFTILSAPSPICSGQDAVFTFKGSANATVTYKIDGGADLSLLLDGSGNGTVTITNPASNVSLSTSNIALGSCSLTLNNTKTVVVNPTPSFTSLTANSPICSGATANFAIEGTANATVTYTLDSGITTKTIVLDGSGKATVSIANASANATITLNSIGLGTCITPLTNTATIVVNTTPTVTSLNATSPICAGQDAVFTVVGTPNATVNYTVNSGTPISFVLDATGNGTILITNPATDVVVNLSTITLGSCPFTLSNTKTVVVKALPTLGTITPKNTAICSGLNADFDITGTPNATLTYTLDGGITTKTIVLDGSGKATITIPNVTASTTVTLSNISSGLCSSTISNSSTVTVNVKPTATLAGTATLCKGDAGSLTVTLTGTQPWNLTYTDGSTPTTVTGITASPYTIAITPDTNATYSLTAVNDANCVGTTSGSAIITVANPSVAISTGCQDNDYVLTAIPSDANGVTYAWYKGANLLTNTTSQIIANGNDTYKVVITSNGCTAEASAIVTSTYCGIPKGISPNGDNLNDFFELSNLSVKKLEIFNRYGMKVYSKTNYKNEWDGKTDDGQELPDGTYYYVIEFESGKVKTGWVYKTNERK